MDNLSVILLGLFTAVIVLMVLVIVILLKVWRGGSIGQEAQLRRDIREEMSRSRRETGENIQGSVKRLGEMISQNQRESADMQSRRLAELGRQLADTSMSIEQRLENIRISMENKVTAMTEREQPTAYRDEEHRGRKTAEDSGRQDRPVFQAGQRKDWSR